MTVNDPASVKFKKTMRFRSLRQRMDYTPEAAQKRVECLTGKGIERGKIHFSREDMDFK
jgi:hypothetical protein